MNGKYKAINWIYGISAGKSFIVENIIKEINSNIKIGEDIPYIFVLDGSL